MELSKLLSKALEKDAPVINKRISIIKNKDNAKFAYVKILNGSSNKKFISFLSNFNPLYKKYRT